MYKYNNTSIVKGIDVYNNNSIVAGIDVSNNTPIVAVGVHVNLKIKISNVGSSFTRPI